MIYGKNRCFRMIKPFCCACIVFSLLAGAPGPGHAQRTLFSKIKKTVILDPGHGGRDSGAKGADNTQEKEIALTFAKNLEAQLQTTYNVVLTRSDDYDQDLTARPETANRSGGDMFISIHTGGNFIHESQGVVLYYYEKDSVPGTSSGESDVTPDEKRRWGAAQEKYSAVSRAFALSLKDHLMNIPDLANVTVEGVTARVLAGADMPAILIEVGYITSPHDEKRLNASGYVHDFSSEVCEGIHEYFNAYSQSR